MIIFSSKVTCSYETKQTENYRRPVGGAYFCALTITSLALELPRKSVKHSSWKKLSSYRSATSYTLEHSVPTVWYILDVLRLYGIFWMCSDCVVYFGCVPTVVYFGCVPTVWYILDVSRLCGIFFFSFYYFNLLNWTFSENWNGFFSDPDLTTRRTTTTASTTVTGTSSITTLGDTSSSTSLTFHFTLYLLSLLICFVC